MTGDEETKRLFFALRPPAAVLDELRAQQEPLRRALDANSRKAGRHVRWTRPGQLHLTLLFLPAWPASRTLALAEAAEAACAPIAAPDLGFASPQLQPARGRPRVIWRAAKGDTASLARLHEELLRVQNTLAPPPQRAGRRFRPHLTIGRIRPAAPSTVRRVLASALNDLESEMAPFWRPTEVEFVESSLESGGARHTVLGHLALDSEVSNQK